jgi:hypothetical protein
MDYFIVDSRLELASYLSNEFKAACIDCGFITHFAEVKPDTKGYNC